MSRINRIARILSNPAHPVNLLTTETFDETKSDILKHTWLILGI